MARLLQAGLQEALSRPNARFSEHSTLQLFIVTGAETRSHYFATASLNFNGVVWQPHLRKTDQISSDLTSDADEATLELQNVDTILGVQFVNLQRYLFGAEAVVGRYWKDLERGTEWHEVLLTGLVIGLNPGETTVNLTLVPDLYSGVSVGPFRKIRRLCTAGYKTFECGRPVTDPPTCDLTVNGAGGCDGRWGSTNKFARHMGAPYIDANLELKLI